MRTLGLSFILLAFALSACQNAEVLSPQPSALDLDKQAPTCPGLTNFSVGSGPSLSVSWDQGADNVSASSQLTYSVYIRTNSGSYDVVSPTKIVLGATTTLVTSGIQLGQTYHAYVTCKDEAGNVYPTSPMHELSVSVTDVSPPTQITDLSASSTSYNSTFLSWSAADDGAGGTTVSQMTYKIFWGNAPGVTTSSPILTTLTGSTSFAVTNLVPSSNYYFRVVAYDLVGNASAPSNEVHVTTLTDTIAPIFTTTSQIAAPTVTTSSITLTWTNTGVTDNVTATSDLVYKIYRCSGSTTCNPFTGTLVTTTSANASTYTNTGLSPSTIYAFGVRAADTSGNVSTNTDKVVTSTTYSSSGYTYAYPTLGEVNQRFGQGLAVANVVGDATGANAWPDLIVGAPNGSLAQSEYRQTGCIYIFAGTGPGAFSKTPTQTICQPSPAGNGGSNTNFGYTVAVGNFDGDPDGTKDLLIANPTTNKLSFYFTRKTGNTLSIDTTAQSITDASGGAALGYGVCVGDLDGTGGLDFAVTRSVANCTDGCGFTGTGLVDIYLNGSTNGNFIVPSVSATITDFTNKVKAAPYNWAISNAEQLARSCAIGKFDAANPTQNQLVIGSGSVSPVSTTPVTGYLAFYRQTGASTFTFQNAIQAPTLTGAQWGDALAAGQVNGTGAQELAVGAPTDSTVGTSAGGVYLYTVGTSSSNFTITDLGVSYYGGTDLDNNGMGSSVFMADLYNRGDGKQDLIAGAALDDNTGTVGASGLNIGKVFVYQNTGGAISSSPIQSDFDISNQQIATALNFGSALCKGDVNNDGIQDLVIGSMGQAYDPVALTNNGNMGAVYIYNGVATGEIDFAHPSQIITAPGSSTSGFGSSCVVMDYNGDGKQDLIVGAPYRTVLGTSNRGAAYVYYGASASSLPTTASATINGPAVQANAYFGWSLAKGDIDNNGFDDLVVGAKGVNNTVTNTGQAYVFWATDSTGVITTTGMTTLVPPNGALGAPGNTYLANTQTQLAGMAFGYSVAVYPTVFGSTGKDVVVCAPVQTAAISDLGTSIPAAAVANIGTCFVYEGKVNGSLGSSYQMMTMPRNEIRYPYSLTSTSTIVSATYFGYGMAVGDWDNDGTDDLVICAGRQYNLSAVTTNVGGCYQFKGHLGGGFQSSTSYRANAGGTRNVPTASDLYYNERPDAQNIPSEFGRSVLLMDVNNNSSLDLLVGEWLTDNPAPIGPSYLGNDSGRVLILRGGYDQ